MSRFQPVPTIFHPVPSKRGVGCVEKQLLLCFWKSLVSQTIRKFKENGKRFKTSSIKQWAHSVARRETNFMLKRIYDRGNRDAMKSLYRYPFDFRRPLYDAICIHGEYALQLTRTFPLLAMSIWSDPNWRGSELRDELEEMVLSGAKLKEIARMAGIPWSLRSVPPQLTNRLRREHYDFADSVWSRHKPQKLDVTRAVVTSISGIARMHFDRIDEENPRNREDRRSARAAAEDHRSRFILWAAKNVEGCMKIMRTRSYSIVVECMSDIADWSADRTWRCPWNPQMSFEKAYGYSLKWHAERGERSREERARAEAERRAPAHRQEREDDNKLVFPDAWVKTWSCSHNKKKYSVVALDRAYKITDEGERMGNCVATYKQDVERGRCYIYSVRTGGRKAKSVATVELRRLEEEHSDYDFYIQQARGPHNDSVDSKVEEVIRKWCKKYKIARKHSDVHQAVVAPTIQLDYGPTGTMAGTVTGTAWITTVDTSTTLTYNGTGDPSWTMAFTTTTTTT